MTDARAYCFDRFRPSEACALYYFTTLLSDRLNQRCLCGERFRQLVRGLGRPPIYELSMAAARDIAWRPSVTLTPKPAGLAHCSVVCCPVRQFASRKPALSAPGALSLSRLIRPA